MFILLLVDLLEVQFLVSRWLQERGRVPLLRIISVRSVVVGVGLEKERVESVLNQLALKHSRRDN